MLTKSLSKLWFHFMYKFDKICTNLYLVCLFCFVSALQHGLCFVPTSTTWLLFCFGFNNMAFALFWHRQHGCQNWHKLVRQWGVAWRLERLHESSHARVTSVMSHNEDWLSDSGTDQARQWSELGPIKVFLLKWSELVRKLVWSLFWHQDPLHPPW